jgi:predicted O-methyltransferase YrrM
VRIEFLRHTNRRLKPHRHKLWAGVLTGLGHHADAAVWLSRLAKGMFNPRESRLLYRTARSAPGPGDIAEIGSWMGRTSILLGLAVRDAGWQDCRVWAIDHHVGSEEHQEYITREGSTLEHFRRNIAGARLGSVVQELVMTSVNAAKVLAQRGVTLRMVFIDGAHDEQSVRQDIRSMLPLMRPGGIMAFHDCVPGGGGFPGVWRAFEAELGSKAEIVERADSLVVSRLRG